MLKLQESFHGSAVGGWASRFGKRGGGDAEGTELPETNARDAAATANPISGPPRERAADGGVGADSPAATPPAATPPAPRESRATQRDREDLRRLEERRDALMARKRRLRELIVARTESDASRVARLDDARPDERSTRIVDAADVAPPPPVSLI